MADERPASGKSQPSGRDSGSSSGPAGSTSRSSGSSSSPTSDRSSSSSSSAATPTSATAPRRTPVTQQIGRVAIAALLVLFGIFVVSNTQPVTVDWLFAETRPPLILVLVGSFVVGALTGWFTTWRSNRR